MNKEKNTTLVGLIWSFAERFGAQIISFVVSIILARLLLPNDYGVVSIVLVFINIANSFVTGGFGSAVIQKKDADDVDFSTIFYFNILFSAAIYAIIFFLAPFVSTFYNNDNLTLIIRVLGIRLLFTGVNSVQRAIVAKKMQFKKFFFATLIGTVLSAIVGIMMAYKGLGVWSLVAQYLTNTIIDTVVLFLIFSWRPRFVFSFERLKPLVAFGWKILVSSVLTATIFELNALAIGKVYSAEDLAFYNRGKKFPQLFVSNIVAAIETVLFPSMSNVQDKTEMLKRKTKNSVRFGAFLVFPICFGLAACSKNLVLVLLTEKWIEAYPFIIIFCIAYCVVPISMANLQTIKAIGKSGVYLTLDIINKSLYIALLITFIRFGVTWIAISELIGTYIVTIINMVFSGKYINYSIKEQFQDIFPILLISVLMFSLVFFENFMPINNILMLGTQVGTGIVLYIGLASLFKVSAMKEIVALFKTLLKKHQKK